MQFQQKNWVQLKNTSIIYVKDTPIATTLEADIFLARKNHSKFTSPLLALKVYKNNLTPSRIINKLIDLQFTNIISFYEVEYQSFPFCLMEFCSKNLKQYQFHSEVDYRNEQILAIARQVLNGMIELKQMRIIHGDIKPQNLLISRQEITKLCDLDFAVTEKEASERCLRVGTFEYMAPEVLLKGKCSYKSDIWSLGIVVYELYFRKHPFPKLRLITHSDEESFKVAQKVISRQIQLVKAQIIIMKEQSQSQTTTEIMNILLNSLCNNAEQRKGLEQLSAIANKHQRIRKMSDFVQDTIEQQGEPPLYEDRALLNIFQSLLIDIKSLPKGDVIQKKAKELESNLQKLINCMQRQTQTRKYDFEALLQKFSIQSRKISSIIENNLKRLGNGVQKMLHYQGRLMFRQHIELANSYLNRQSHRQTVLDKGFHSATQLSERK